MWRSMALVLTATVLVGASVLQADDGAKAGSSDRQEAIIFVRIKNKPNGRPGIHYEPFMYHFGQSAHVPGMEIVKLSPPRPDGKITVLTPEFYGADEPELSYDGRKIIFSGRRTPKDGWEVWEMDIDGKNKRQITKGMADVCSPCYLPDGRIVFSSTRHVAMNPERRRDEYDRDQPRLVHRCNPDGSNVEQISFNLSSDSEFIVLSDGRILFSSWQHHGMRFHTSGASALFTMNPDGTEFIDFFGNHRGGFRWKARELPDGRIVYIESVFHHAYGGGWLALLTPGDPDDNRAVQNLTPDVKLYGPDTPGGRYRDPYPTQDGSLLVCWSPPPCWSAYRNPTGPQAQFGIYWFDLASKKRAAPVYNDPNYQALNPVYVEPRPVPPVIPDHNIDRRVTYGTLLCLNAYLGQTDKEAFIKPGQIRRVRIIEGFGVEDKSERFRTLVPGIGFSSFGSSTNSISNFEQKRVVGEAPVASDGSFFVKVPADTVLHLQVVDENGMALQDALTWIWVRPNEHRTCVGCHERRSQPPLLDSVPLAATAGPVDLTTPPEKRRTVDFRRDLMPIIEKRCTGCHNATDKAGGLDLSGGNELVFIERASRPDQSYRIMGAFFNKAYLSLCAPGDFRIGKYIYPGLARRSPLIWRLYGYDFEHQVPIEQCPPDQPLSDQEKRLFALWIDLGAQWDNLPGEDPYPSYSREHSRQLASKLPDYAKLVVHDPVKATEVRCGECHGLRRPLEARKTAEEWRRCIQTMAEKRKGWIKDEEIPLIASYLAEITSSAGELRTWYLLGPLDNSGGHGIRTRLPIEAGQIDPTRPVVVNGKEYTWKRITVEEKTGIVNLSAALGARGASSCYALAILRVAQPCRLWLRVSADDMFELFVNGTPSVRRLVRQPFWYDWDIIPVDLKQGDNQILLKIHNFSGPARFRARLTVGDELLARPVAAEVNIESGITLLALRNSP